MTMMLESAHWSIRRMKVEFTAKGSGYYKVYVDGVETTKHVTERESLEKATNASTPDNSVKVIHDYEVEILTIPDPDPDPELEPDPEPESDPDPNLPTTAIFKDSFDTDAELAVSGRKRRINDPDGVGLILPGGFDFQYTSQNNSTNPPGIITSPGQLDVWDESYGDNNSWGHDLQIMKFFSKNYYPELWCKFQIKFNGGADVSGFNVAKIFRAGAYNPAIADGTYQASMFNTTGKTDQVEAVGNTTCGLLLWDIKREGTYFTNKFLIRGNPSYKRTGYIDYYFQGSSGRYADDTWSGISGVWLTYEIQVLYDSAIGTKDGAFNLYLDNVKQTLIAHKNFKHADESSMNADTLDFRNLTPDWSLHVPTGFNCVSLGGNMDSVWSGQSNDEQHMYSVKKIEISTERLPYV